MVGRPLGGLVSVSRRSSGGLRPEVGEPAGAGRTVGSRWPARSAAVIAEMIRWFDRYVKAAAPRAKN